MARMRPLAEPCRTCRGRCQACVCYAFLVVHLDACVPFELFAGHTIWRQPRRVPPTLVRPSPACRDAPGLPSPPLWLPACPQVFSQLLLEEVRAHLQQAAEENPAAPALCRRGGSASWHEAAPALAAAGAAPLRLLEVQRQSELHLLRFEPAGGASGSGQGESAAEFARSSGIRADDLLLIASRAAAPAPPAGGAGAGPQQAPVAVALAAVESVQLSQPSDRRPQQGIVGRQRQLLLTMRVCLRSVGSSGGSSGGGGGAGAARQLLQQQLTLSTQWQAVRLFSLTPHLRQLQALVAAQKLPPLLLAELLDPRGSAAGGEAAQQAQQPQLSSVQPPLAAPLLRQLEQQYNSSQRGAIAAAVGGFRAAAGGNAAGAQNSAGGGGEAGALPARRQQQAGQQLVLVQGPPGTGKTAAILGMLSAFLAPNTPKPGKAADGSSTKGGGSAAGKQRVAAAGAPGRQGVVNPTVRVLLAAQSNAAVDELCARLAARGVIGRCAPAVLKNTLQNRRTDRQLDRMCMHAKPSWSASAGVHCSSGWAAFASAVHASACDCPAGMASSATCRWCGLARWKQSARMRQCITLMQLPPQSRLQTPGRATPRVGRAVGRAVGAVRPASIAAWHDGTTALLGLRSSGPALAC